MKSRRFVARLICNVTRGNDDLATTLPAKPAARRMLPHADSLIPNQAIARPERKVADIQPPCTRLASQLDSCRSERERTVTITGAATVLTARAVSCDW